MDVILCASITDAITPTCVTIPIGVITLTDAVIILCVSITGVAIITVLILNPPK
jgi:hypothetical protein